MNREEFLRAYQTAVESVVDKTVTHPEDIMAAVLTASEAIYALVSALPSGAFKLDLA